ncbi:MAG: hypothetical protein H0T69_01570 [Thermoleophilaceae bacterium]|nr:hypothetical protein [Thermoleophilaceae bacterium]
MFLKAVLAMRGVGYERTHDIERLTSLVSDDDDLETEGRVPPALRVLTAR